MSTIIHPHYPPLVSFEEASSREGRGGLAFAPVAPSFAMSKARCQRPRASLLPTISWRCTWWALPLTATLPRRKGYPAAARSFFSRSRWFTGLWPPVYVLILVGWKQPTVVLSWLVTMLLTGCLNKHWNQWFMMVCEWFSDIKEVIIANHSDIGEPANVNYNQYSSSKTNTIRFLVVCHSWK